MYILKRILLDVNTLQLSLYLYNNKELVINKVAIKSKKTNVT